MQRTQGAHLSDSSQLPKTPAPQNPRPSFGRCTHIRTHAHTHTNKQVHLKKKKRKKSAAGEMAQRSQALAALSEVDFNSQPTT